MIKKLLSRQFILYLFFGMITTIIDMGTFYILNTKFSVNYVIATVIAWIFSVIFAYFSSRTWVFSSNTSDNIIKEMSSFFFLRVLSLVISILLMIFLVEILKINEFIAKLIVNLFVVLSNYFFNKFFIFKKRR